MLRIYNDGIVFSRYLFFSQAAAGDIAKYDLTTKNFTDVYSNNAIARYLIADTKNEVIYWSQKPGSGIIHYLLSTHYNGTTVINDTYISNYGNARFAQSERYLYLLNPTSSEIVKYQKKSFKIVATFTVHSNSTDITATDGKLASRIAEILSKDFSCLKQTTNNKHPTKNKYKKVGVLPIRIVKSNVSSVCPSSAERK